MMRPVALVLALMLGAVPTLADEAAERKARSIALLQAEGVPVLESLPVIATEVGSRRRDEEEVVQRTIALVIVAVKGETNDPVLAQDLIVQFDALGYFTPDEQAFINNPAPSMEDQLKFSWRYEGVHVMLWSLGIYPDLGRPDQLTDVPLMADTLRELGAEGLRRKARLRPQAELLDAADLIYRQDWAAVEARLQGQPAPAGLNEEVLFERHSALNWLIGYRSQSWDEISPDT